MIPACRDEISPYDYMWKLNFVLARRDSFPPGIWFDLHAFPFVSMSFYKIEDSKISTDLKFFYLSCLVFSWVYSFS